MNSTYQYFKTGIILLLFLLYNAFNIIAQNITISGYVKDIETSETLIGVNLFSSQLQKGTVSNSYGFFSLSLPKSEETIEIKISYVGYEEQILSLKADETQELTIQLKINNYDLEVIEIVAKSDEVEQTQMSTIDLSIKTIEKLPALMGEVDVIKAIQLMPGVQSGTEGTSGIYVRGGSPDQNLILLDGVPVYNAAHLFGFFSVFNNDAIKNVSLLKGGFPARYGGRLSSVVDINMKEGNMQKVQASGNIGLIASKLLVEGPIKKDTTSFLVTARRTYYDLLARPIINQIGSSVPNYYFYDLNAKINHIFSSKDRLFFSLYTGRDRFLEENKNTVTLEDQTQIEDKEAFKLRWGNITSALRWNHLFSNKLFANTTLTYSFYQFQTDKEESLKSVDNDDLSNSNFLSYQSQIRDFGAKIDFDFYPSTAHTIKFGAQATHHNFLPGATQYNTDTINTNLSNIDDINTQEYAAYVEDEIQIGTNFKANLGIHSSAFHVRDKWYFSVQPRVSLYYAVSDNWSTKASFATMTQYIHLLSNSNAGFPTDLWVPSTDRIAPQESWQVAGGVSGKINNQKLTLSIEGYYKKLNQVIDYSQGVNFLQDGPDTDLVEASRQAWEDAIEVGQGWNYGGEILLQKNKGRTTGWIGYTLSWSDRQFDKLNFGEKFPYKYDKRHDFSLVVSHQLKENIDLSGSWVYSTGNAITLPTGVYPVHPEMDFGGGIISVADDYEKRNGFRNKAYHRLDFGINFNKNKKWGERTWSISLYNAYSRRNPFYLYFDGQPGNYKLTQASLFPIIPSISYKFKLQ